MRVVFGWNTLKVRSFSLLELGIIKETEPGVTFEVRQAYFHLFWIPFFGLGKRWVVRKGGNTYEMPLEIQRLAQSNLSGVRTPWYTFTGPLLLLTAFLVFTAYTKVNTYKRHKQTISNFNERTAELTAKLQHLTTNDFITLEDVEYGSREVFLKVEDIKGDELTVTPVVSYNGEPMSVEREYIEHNRTLPSIKISYKQLLAAYPKEYDSSIGVWRKRQAINLLKDDLRFIVADVVPHFRPNVKASFTNFRGNNISIRCYNEGWPGTITEIKNVVGNIDWSKMINTELPGGQSRLWSGYDLDGTGIKYGQPYKFIMTLKDSTGHFHKYEFEGDGRKDVTVHSL